MPQEKYFDNLETRDPQLRQEALLAALPTQIAYAKANVSAYAELFSEINPAEIDTRVALANLPITRKGELLIRQRDEPPFGGYLSQGSAVQRVFASPGPIYEPQGVEQDYWRLARALYAAGVRGGELVHNAFSYHFTPAGFMLESAAHALGCSVFPAGAGQTEQQVKAIQSLQPSVYVGTPSFLKIILEKALGMEIDLACLNKALVSGEALPPSLRQEFEHSGVKVLQCYATADIGLIAYESEAREGLILGEDILVEVVRPGTGEPVAEGEVGELVVTTFNKTYPLVRFATGDLSAIMPGVSACGRTNTRIKGWLGRADQAAKVKGMFVRPEQIADIVKRHEQLGRVRLVVNNPGNKDVMILRCETNSNAGKDQILASIREVTKLRGEVEFVPLNSLPNDGKVIDDIRTYE